MTLKVKNLHFGCISHIIKGCFAVKLLFWLYLWSYLWVQIILKKCHNRNQKNYHFERKTLKNLLQLIISFLMDKALQKTTELFILLAHTTFDLPFHLSSSTPAIFWGLSDVRESHQRHEPGFCFLTFKKKRSSSLQGCTERRGGGRTCVIQLSHAL